MPVAAAEPRGAIALRVLSNRADLISGGDALVEVVLPHADLRRLRVTAAGRDVTTRFALRPNGRVQGLVTGLPVGPSDLVARAGRNGARLRVVNHPIGGPVIAGRQTQPWICGTEAAGLGPPRNRQCDVAPSYRWLYVSTNPLMRGYQSYDVAAPPTDVATTRTDQGREVPHVIRIESGVIDRGIYSIAVLADPGRPWLPWAPQPGWNGKVLWPFGGDCKPWHVQDPPIDVTNGTPVDPPLLGLWDFGYDEGVGGVFGTANAPVALARGFAVATSSNNKFGSQCNVVVSAESVMMVKEHIVETYGPIRYTIGAGESGGAMQQHGIAAAYPGLLDGIQVIAGFPDFWEPYQQAADCALMTRYFDTVAPHLWPLPAQNVVMGNPVSSLACRTEYDGPTNGTPVVGNFATMFFDPANAVGCGLDEALVYDAQTNPRGVRCTIADYLVSVLGRRRDGFANRPFDNVGVQYGLEALRSGLIVAEQFVDLNEKVGGIDIDYGHQAARSVADPGALAVAYRGGLVVQGMHLADVPMFDIRGHDNIEAHADFQTYTLRARLDRDYHRHDNHVVFTSARPLAGDPASIHRAFDLVDEWLTRVEADRSRRSRAEKVRVHRPADAVDTCWFEGRPVTDQGVCRTLFPYFGDPRLAAGGPMTDDVIKCRLRPLRRDDYPVAFTDDQWQRLQTSFPSGVCDYALPPVGMARVVPWSRF